MLKEITLLMALVLIGLALPIPSYASVIIRVQKRVSLTLLATGLAALGAAE